jgi:hypothetical protein
LWAIPDSVCALPAQALPGFEASKRDDLEYRVLSFASSVTVHWLRKRKKEVDLWQPT